MLLLSEWAQVITEDIAQVFSDVYKSDYGFRPDLSAWDRLSMEGYLDSRDAQEYYDVEYESYMDELAAEYYADMAYEAEAEAQVDEWELIASQYQEGWA